MARGPVTTGTVVTSAGEVLAAAFAAFAALGVIPPPFLARIGARGSSPPCRRNREDVTCTPESRATAQVRDGSSAMLEVSAAMSAKVLERFPAGAPRGSWPAEEYAAQRRAQGEPATVVMDLKSDAFLVVVPGRDED
jgi:hypothetical protein